MTTSTELAEQLPGLLRRHIEYMISVDPALAVLVGRAAQWYPALRLVIGELLAEAVDADMPEYNLRRGEIGVRQDLLHAVLALEAAACAETKSDPSMLHGIVLSRPFRPLNLEAGDTVILDEPGTDDPIILYRPLPISYSLVLAILESGAGTSGDPDVSDAELKMLLVRRIQAAAGRGGAQ